MSLVVTQNIVMVPILDVVKTNVSLVRKIPITVIELNVNQHDSAGFNFTVTDEVGDPILFTTMAEVVFSVARRKNANSLISLTKTSGRLYEIAANQFYLELTSAETGSLDPGEYYCEIRYSVDSRVATLGGGIFRVADTQIGDL